MPGRGTVRAERRARPRATAPDRTALGRRTCTLLYERERERMSAWIVTKGVDVDDAADLVHEAFLRLWTRCTRELDDPRAYLYRTMGNLIKNHFKHADVVRGCDAGCLPRPVRCPTPDEVLAGRELGEVLEATLAQMAVGPREVMRGYLDGDGVTDIAKKRGLMTSTVRVHLHRARGALEAAMRHLNRDGSPERESAS